MQQDDSFYFQAIEFARRGYAVVVPTREGFGSSGGTYFRANCNLTEGARHWANSVQAAIGKEAQAKATKVCEERGGVGCQLYALGNVLVYKGPFAAAGKTVAAPSANSP
ncbi:hypothetical protein [Paraburkholderia bryophila]|uniref:Uncharacterized protein n=1 Tax=Paraburkholderia bryophila TaxID=420952 RepID=A0A7Y9WQR5_9BURK|nr:hypothetical protein [Paraburkholderia bryophila]NYH24853.1 hypothetical protein [Paraburkholderia bryophila]